MCKTFGVSDSVGSHYYWSVDKNLIQKSRIRKAAIITAHCSQSAPAEITYEIGKDNTNACAEGRVALTVDECKEAAKKLFPTIKNPQRNDVMQGPGNLREKAPKGCSYRGESGFVFNDHETGGTDQFRAPVCKLERSEVPTHAPTQALTGRSFKICSATAGRHYKDNYPSPTVHYVAYQVGFTTSKENLSGGHIDLKTWYTGSKCATIKTPHHVTITNRTRVHVSVEHQRTHMNTDAMVAWSEIVRDTRTGKHSVRLCARELQNFDGKHSGIRLHWLIVDGVETPQLSETGEVIFSERMIDGEEHPTVCHERIQFNYLYPVLPEFSVIVSATPVRPKLQSTGWSNEGIVSWVEQSATGYLRACVKRVRTNGKQGAVRVTYSVFPKLCEVTSQGSSDLFYNGDCYSLVKEKTTYAELKTSCKAGTSPIAMKSVSTI
jgi:hypothetical protein